MRTRDCDAQTRRGRLRKANGFYQAAEDVAALNEAGEANDAVVTLHVHAGIAAADVLSCARLGKHSTGESHTEAVALLATVSQQQARHLATLLGMKTKAGYSHQPASDADVKRAIRAADQLVKAARQATG